MESKLKRDRVMENEEQKESTQEDEPVSKRRSIRSHYREIGNRIDEGKDEIASGDLDKFMAIMNEFENMHQHVNKPREQVADAEALLGLTSTLVASVKTHTSGNVTPAELVSCLIRDFGQKVIMKRSSEISPSVSWQNIGYLVSPIFMNVPGCTTMVGAMENEIKQEELVRRVKRLRSTRKARAEGKARPEEVEKKAEVVTDTDRNFIVMFEKLKKEKQVKVENLMLNRNSFAQTVENLFALSFLVKDGRVRIDVDETGSQVAIPSNGPSAEEIKTGVAKSHQFIFRYDFDDWKLMKTLVPEGEEAMPQRAMSTAESVANRGEPGDKHFSQPKPIPGLTGLDFFPAETSLFPATLIGSHWKPAISPSSFFYRYLVKSRKRENFDSALLTVIMEIMESTRKGTESPNVPESQPADNADTNNGKDKKQKGGWGYAVLLLSNQGLATLAFFGAGVNLVLFLTRVLGQNNAIAANNISIWTGTVYLCSLVGAFLSDSYWGRYLTCAIFQVILVLGLALLSVASWLFLVKPKGCGDGQIQCQPPTSMGTSVFYLAIYLAAFGYGGHQPTIATFGADQFDETQETAKAAFFNYFYVALNSGSLISNTILVYLEDNGKWTIGFWASTGSAIVALVAYLLGSPGYRYMKPCGNPIPRVVQVFVAATRKWGATLKPGEELYEVEGSMSAIKGSRKIGHTDELRCLDKAAIVTEEDRRRQGSSPWQLCTITQVEEAKCMIRMMPIWLCTIMYSVLFTQMASLYVEQGDVMDTRIGNFKIPAASMSAFGIISVLIFTAIYRTALVPLASKITGNPQGLTELQRMGIGLIIAILSIVAAGITEMWRLKAVSPGKHESSMRVFWQIPQYVLIGSSEVFMYVGQLEFFNSQAPDGMKSFGSSLCMASISVGNFLSSFLVNIVTEITSSNKNPGWIPQDLNEGHMDRFYFFLAILATVDFLIFLVCAKRYQSVDLNPSTGGEGENDEEQAAMSRV
ncbi:protein NRT1/ PTR FAMILY 7.1 [Sesamum alatum]|uniref:Protein NRT1/ PTR FAMILY 7.1 n=1 Tax=Sesamum alatum TaxID=300844 RepID=A0AAE1Z3X1_9LAMI|nr:protein NRT1/ PTR FAMILY 7.1 [Sesamum alatum]